MSDDGKVGYRRPPRETRFRPGQSGNPRGRPAGVRNLKSDLLDELRQDTTIRENGHEHSVSKQRAFIKALVAAAINGDIRATNTLLSFCSHSLSGQTDDANGAPPGAEDDLDIIENFITRERKQRHNPKEEIRPPKEQEEKKPG